MPEGPPGRGGSLPISSADFPRAWERRKPKIRTTPKLITAQNFDLCSFCSAGAPSLWASYFLTCVSVCPAWGQGHSVLERGCSSEGCLRGLSRWMGEFWGSGLGSWGCFCILSTDWFNAKCGSCPGNRRQRFPSAAPPRMCLQSPVSSFSVFLPDRSLLALFINFAAQCHGFNRRGG